MVNLEKALGQLFLGERREGKGNRRYNPSNKMWGYFLRVSGLRNVVSVRDAIQEAKIRGLYTLWSEWAHFREWKRCLQTACLHNRTLETYVNIPWKQTSLLWRKHGCVMGLSAPLALPSNVANIGSKRIIVRLPELGEKWDWNIRRSRDWESLSHRQQLWNGCSLVLALSNRIVCSDGSVLKPLASCGNRANELLIENN